MKQPIPNDQIIKLQETRLIEAFQVDYTITATGLGEVLSVTSPLLSLPTTAQRLMIGGKYEQVIAKAKGMASLFPYALPLVAMGYLKEEEWQSLATQLADFQKTTSANAPTKSSSIWVQQAYQLHQQSAPNKALQLAAQLIFSAKQARSDALKKYTAAEKEVYKGEFIGPLLLQLLPISKDPYTLHAIYQALATYPCDSVYLLLSNRLNNPAFKKYHTSILKGLKPYKEVAHQEVLATYYESMPFLGGEGLAVFMEGVAVLPLPQQKQLLYHILTSDNRVAAAKAYEQLQRVGLTEEEFAKKLYTVFKERRSLENMRAILKLYDRVTKTVYLPTGTELLGVLKWANEQKKAIAINYSLTDKLAKRLDEKGFVQLLELLKNEISTVREAALDQVTSLSKAEHTPLLSAILPEVVPAVQQRITFILKKILERYSIKEPLAPLLQLLGETDTLKIETIKPIRRLLQRRVDTAAIDPLLQELSNADPVVRRAVVKTLRVFKDKKVIKALEQVAKKDTDSLVKKNAQKSLAWIASPLSEQRKIEREQKEQIENYLEEMIDTNEQENGRPLSPFTRFVMKSFGRFYYGYFPKDEWKE